VLNISNGDNVTVYDVIKCSANTVYPPVIYYWQRYMNDSWQQLQQQDNDGNHGDWDGDDSSGSVLRLYTVGVYVLRCAAYNVIGNITHNTTSGIVTLYVIKSGKCYNYFAYCKLNDMDNKVKECFTVACMQHDIFLCDTSVRLVAFLLCTAFIFLKFYAVINIFCTVCNRLSLEIVSEEVVNSQPLNTFADKRCYDLLCSCFHMNCEIVGF